MEQLYVGIGRADITPPLGTMLRGYTPVRPCTSVHDGLNITVFLFAQGNTRAMMVSADLCTLFDESYRLAVDTLAQAGNVPVEHIILASTHTHSGPHLNIGEKSRPILEQVFLPAAAKAAKAAAESLRPACMGIGTTLSDVAIHRRQITESGRVALGQNPYGPYDPTMTVISFKEPDGTPIGNMIHYGCHNTGSGKNAEVTRDWCGVAIDRLEKESGGITAFFNGCGGDCGPRLSNGKTTGDLQLALELGGRAATDAVRAWKNIRIWENTPVKVLCEDIRLPMQGIGTPEQIRARIESMGDISKLPGSKQNAVELLRRRIAFLEAGNTPPEYKDLPHNPIALGPVVFFPMPFEPFSIITLRVKEHSPYPYTVCVGYANDNQSYFPSMDQIVRGGYEVDAFYDSNLVPFANDAEQHYVKGCLKLIRKLYEQ